MIYFKKKLWSTALRLFFFVMTTYTINASAAMNLNAVLSYTPIPSSSSGVKPNLPSVGTGSYFDMPPSTTSHSLTPLTSLEGIKLGKTQPAAGAHTGVPSCVYNGTSCNNTGESPTVGKSWSFFGSTGMHGVYTTPITIVTDDSKGNVTLDMAGWEVMWNSEAVKNGAPVKGSNIINMGTGAHAVVKCADANSNGVFCDPGDTYVLDYAAVVPSGPFTGVHYALHLEGTISAPPLVNSPPFAKDDMFDVIRKATGRSYTPSVLDIIANDTDPDGKSDINRATVTINPNGTDTTKGTVSVNAVTGNITYTPVDNAISPPSDSFTYTVKDKGGPLGAGHESISNMAIVTITIKNAIPVAVNDSVILNTSSAKFVAIDVTKNDTDSDGKIDTTTVAIDPANSPAHGTLQVNPTTGFVTYTPNAGYIGVDTFKYSVKDNDGATSNFAKVIIVVKNGVGVLPDNAFLIMNPGTGKPGGGSYFTMEVKPGQLTPVGLTGFDHIQLGVKQLASAAMPGIDEPWKFFGNLGVDQTTKPITILTDDKKGNVTLDFSGWDVSWNNIPKIPLNNGLDNGIATLTCGKDCSIGDSYTLIYHATVPPGDPSGFGGVHYVLHLVGTISDKAPTVGGGSAAAPYRVTNAQPIVGVDDSTSPAPNPITIGPGSIAIKAGNTTGTDLTMQEVGKDPLLNINDGEQCVGGCIDFIATGVTTKFVDLVFKLSQPIPGGAIFRKLIHGKWTGFSTAAGDQVGTANADASGNCQGPEGKYNSGLRKGATCIFLRVYDGGPNDADGVINGTIVDPSGVLLKGSSNVPPGSSHISSSGCSISPTPVSIESRADWLLVAGFISLLGLLKIKRKSHD